jgi:hypothetical protein
MYGCVVIVLKTLIPCAQMLLIVHVQDMHDHPIDNLGLAINLGLEGHAIRELGVQS